MKRTHMKAALLLVALISFSLTVLAAAVPKELPRPDGKPADMSKPVQVYLLMGQSNAVGMGKLASLEAAVKQKKKYPYLVDEAGNWNERKDVRNVFIMMGKLQLNDWMSVKNRKTVGVEYAIGHLLGNATDAPVMILKNCVGNRSLGYDLLPPSAVGTGAGGKSYEGNKDGTPKDGPWYAGREYDTDVADAKTVLADLDKYYPGAKKYEIAGIFFWQGAKDLGKGGSADNYEVNLVHFIKDLRKSFNAPKALFVCATLGEAKKGGGGNEGKILDAQLAVDGKTGKYPEFKGNVATFYSNPVSMGGSANGHYSGNAETYMNVGEGMGRAMLELIGTSGNSSK